MKQHNIGLANFGTSQDIVGLCRVSFISWLLVLLLINCTSLSCTYWSSDFMKNLKRQLKFYFYLHDDSMLLEQIIRINPWKGLFTKRVVILLKLTFVYFCTCYLLAAESSFDKIFSKAPFTNT